jgi:parvulin-like peptidyl-prolyl isomerase
MIPDWAPWAVLGGLGVLSLLGGFGFLGGSKASAEEPASAAPATSVATTTASARPLPSARRMDGADGERIEARHLLVKYQGAMRAEPTVTRTKDQAKKRAEEALSKIKKGGDFATVVGEYSEDTGSAKRGGNLGPFTKGRMVKPFADAAFALKPGETSAVVESPFGFHVIQRTK